MLVRFFQERNIYYGWVILAVAFLTMFLVMGFRYAFGVYYVAILEDTGWQRAETAGIFSTAMVVYALTSILSGAMFDWLGPRVLFPLGSAVLGVGLLLCSTIQSIWEFYLYYGVIVGVAYSMVGFITHMAYVPRWFVRRRGLTASLALSGIGVGALVISPLSEELIRTFGWRTTFFALGICMLVVLVPLTALFHRNSPEAVGLHPDGAAAPSGGEGQPQAQGATLGGAMRQPAFWMLFLAVFTVGLGNMTLVVHQTRMLVDIGFTFTLSAALLGTTGFLRSFGGMIWGHLSDRIGRTPCISFLCIAGVAGLALLILTGRFPHLVLLFGYVLMWGMGYTGISPIYASTVADLFHGKHLGKILGTLDQGFGLGAASGPFVAGLIFDRFGSYEPLLWALMGSVVLTGFTLWSAASRIPRRV
jgi:MFS family permease